MRDALPQTIYLQDYKASAFLIDKTDLVFDLGEDHSRVTATLAVRRNPDSDEPSADFIARPPLPVAWKTRTS